MIAWALTKKSVYLTVVLILVQNVHVQNVKIVANRFHRKEVRWGTCLKKNCKNYQHKGNFGNLLTREVHCKTIVSSRVADPDTERIRFHFSC
jgi:hypothetical protein